MRADLETQTGSSEAGPRPASYPGERTVRLCYRSLNPSGWRDQMTAFIGRREFITLLGGAASRGRRWRADSSQRPR